MKNNLLHHGGAAAPFVKHSSRNRFVRDTALQLRGDSRNDAFENS